MAKPAVQIIRVEKFRRAEFDRQNVLKLKKSVNLNEIIVALYFKNNFKKK